MTARGSSDSGWQVPKGTTRGSRRARSRFQRFRGSVSSARMAWAKFQIRSTPAAAYSSRRASTVTVSATGW